MLIYPQLSTGALSQFPIAKHRNQRTIANAAADGSWVKLADPAGATTEWQLNYSGLSDSELKALQDCFIAAEGSLNEFTFVDPAGNLMAWSADLTNAVWKPAPFMTIADQVSDPFGGVAGFRLTNTGGGTQNLLQTLNAPGAYLYCFSVYVRSSFSTSVTLALGPHQVNLQSASTWERISIAGYGDPNATSFAAGIELRAGATCDVFGPQVEAQAAPSAYQKSTTGGIYEGARFSNDLFSFESTGPNRNSLTLNIVYANHL